MQSIPLHRLPLMITAQRKFSFNGSMLDFSVTKSDGQPGDITKYGDSQGKLHSRMGGTAAGGADGMPVVKEDVPGVPIDAWCRVTRGVPPLDPYTPGGWVGPVVVMCQNLSLHPVLLTS